MSYIKQWTINGTTYDIKATADGDGNIITSTYLPLSGGTMTGPLSFISNSLPEFPNSPPFYCGIESFSNGGTLKWKAAEDCHVGNATWASEIHSPYKYPGNILSQSTTAESLFGDDANINKMSCSFMGSSAPWGDWSDVLYFTGYCKWGATQIATQYNANYPRVAIRKYVQGSTMAYGQWNEFIMASTIGSQSVNYATKTTYLYADNSPYQWNGTNPYYAHMTYNTNGDNRWYLRVYPETPKAIAVDYAYNSGTASNADTLDGYHGSTSASANTYVLRDGNNYIYTNYINSNTGNNENPSISQIIVTNGSDNYYRKASLAHLRNSLAYPRGFASFTSGASWGNTTGTSFCSWNDETGGSIDFRRDNPSSGKMSLKVDGRVYVNEGTNPCMGMVGRSYWGMGTPDADGTSWICTTVNGLLPYTSGGSSAGHSSLGTSSWYFSSAYIQNIYGTTNGNHYGRIYNATVTASSWLAGQNGTNAGVNLTNATDTGSYWPWMRQTNTGSSKWFSFGILNTSFYLIGSTTSRTANSYDYGFVFNIANGQGSASKWYGAVWNDYAEYRECTCTEPGRCVIETGNDNLIISTERLQKGAEIISDTFGFAIGETEKCKTPIAATGRVLAYSYEDREIFKAHIGDPVCSGPNGTVSLMTKIEEIEYASSVIGYVSAVPEYEIWGTENIQVNNRIWIRIR